jgi:hypothetical protein
MSDVAAASKAAKSTAAPAAPAKPVQTLREAQPKKFPPSALQVIGHDYDTLTITAPADWTFEDAMRPVAWANVCRLVARAELSGQRNKIGSIIELRNVSHTFFARLYIKEVMFDHLKNPCGLKLICVGPSFDPKTGEARPINLATGKAWVDPVKPDASE